jgi:hypothetical protein
VVERGAALDRQAVQDIVQVRLDVGQLLGLQHAFEDVEPAAPVGLEDVRVHAAVGREADRAAVAQRLRPLLAGLQVGLHRGLFRTIVDGGFPHRLVHWRALPDRG